MANGPWQPLATSTGHVSTFPIKLLKGRAREGWLREHRSDRSPRVEEAKS